MGLYVGLLSTNSFWMRQFFSIMIQRLILIHIWSFWAHFWLKSDSVFKCSKFNRCPKNHQTLENGANRQSCIYRRSSLENWKRQNSIKFVKFEIKFDNSKNEKFEIKLKDQKKIEKFRKNWQIRKKFEIDR